MELSEPTVHGLLFLTLGLAGEMTILPCLSEAALVIRGVTTGAVVEATLMVSARLWPGTFEKVRSCSSLDKA